MQEREESISRKQKDAERRIQEYSAKHAQLTKRESVIQAKVYEVENQKETAAQADS